MTIPAQSEHDIQSQIRIAISQNGSRSFRINVGVAWTSNKIKKIVMDLKQYMIRARSQRLDQSMKQKK